MTRSLEWHILRAKEKKKSKKTSISSKTILQKMKVKIQTFHSFKKAKRIHSVRYTIQEKLKEALQAERK